MNILRIYRATSIRTLQIFQTKPRQIDARKFSTMPDPIDHATGLEKRELLAKLAGNADPWDMKVIKRASGTRDDPTEIPSAFNARIIGCICDDVSAHIVWQWLYKDEPTRCECGYWFKLVYKPPF